MSTDSAAMTIGGIRIAIVRKRIKNLHLGVYPPEGRVRVAAPLAVSDEAIRLTVIRKLTWVRRQQARFRSQPRQSPREFVTGESHYFLGQRYRLNVIAHPGAARVAISGAHRIDLMVEAGSDASRRERVFSAWQREQLRTLSRPIIERWQKVLEVRVAERGIKRMKTKWGSCNVRARRIWLNLQLAEKPVHCVEYVVVHELAHLIERSHDPRFVAIMDRNLPQWRRHRDELGEMPLGYEAWVEPTEPKRGGHGV